MARSFLITIDAVTAEQDVISSFKVYESVDGLSAWSVVDTIDVGDLTTDPVSGQEILVSPNADDANFQAIIPVTAVGQEGSLDYATLIVPANADPSLGTLYVNLAFWNTIGRQPMEGALLSASPVAPQTIGGFVTTVGPWTAKTAADGTASITLPVGIAVTVSLADAGISDVAIDETVSSMNLANYV